MWLELHLSAHNTLEYSSLGSLLHGIPEPGKQLMEDSSKALDTN